MNDQPYHQCYGPLYREDGDQGPWRGRRRCRNKIKEQHLEAFNAVPSYDAMWASYRCASLQRTGSDGQWREWVCPACLSASGHPKDTMRRDEVDAFMRDYYDIHRGNGMAAAAAPVAMRDAPQEAHARPQAQAPAQAQPQAQMRPPGLPVTTAEVREMREQMAAMARQMSQMQEQMTEQFARQRSCLQTVNDQLQRHIEATSWQSSSSGTWSAPERWKS